jgi:hypothetical protein
MKTERAIAAAAAAAALSALGVGSTGALAQADTGPRPSAEAQQLTAAPPAQMDQLKAFLGTWTCSGNQGDSLFGSAHPVQSAVTGKADLGGFWVQVRFEEQKTAENDHPATGVYSYSYNPTAKQFVAIWTDSLGGWGTQTSAGWLGDTLVLVGDYDVAGQKIGARDTFQRTSAGIVSHLSELQVQGQWIKLQNEFCHS